MTVPKAKRPASTRLISVVVPCYNEAEVIERTHNEIKKVLLTIKRPYEIIYANDGSTDDTGNVLGRIASRDDHVKVIFTRQNEGLAATYALLYGAATGEIIIQLDADLSIDAGVIIPLLEGTEDADVVIASRYAGISADVPLTRYVSSELYSYVNRALFGIKVRDTQSGFVAFRREAIQGISMDSSRFVCHIEIVAKLTSMGKKIVEIPARYVHRIQGSSFSLMRDGPATLLGTMRLWWKLKRSR